MICLYLHSNQVTEGIHLSSVHAILKNKEDEHTVFSIKTLVRVKQQIASWAVAQHGLLWLFAENASIKSLGSFLNLFFSLPNKYQTCEAIMSLIKVNGSQ